MVNITDFTKNCQDYTDLQVIDATFANGVDTPFTYACVDIFSNGFPQNPPFPDCSTVTGLEAYTTFCIGGVNQQHACAAEQCKDCSPPWTCQGIDWTNDIAPACPKYMLDVVESQSVGIVPICCDNSTCVVQDPSSSACDTSRASVYCVNDSTSAECLDTTSSSICSGNYSAAIALPQGGSSTSGGESSSTVHNPPSSPANTGASSGSDTSTSSSSSSSGGGGLSASDIASIVGSIVGAITAIIGLYIAWRSSPKLRDRIGKRYQKAKRSSYLPGKF